MKVSQNHVWTRLSPPWPQTITAIHSIHCVQSLKWTLPKLWSSQLNTSTKINLMELPWLTFKLLSTPSHAFKEVNTTPYGIKKNGCFSLTSISKVARLKSTVIRQHQCSAELRAGTSKTSQNTNFGLTTTKSKSLESWQGNLIFQSIVKINTNTFYSRKILQPGIMMFAQKWDLRSSSL